MILWTNCLTNRLPNQLRLSDPLPIVSCADLIPGINQPPDPAGIMALLGRRGLLLEGKNARGRGVDAEA